MTENLPAESEKLFDAGLLNPSVETCAKTIKAMNYIVDLFRLITVHEIRTATFSTILELFPGSLEAFYDLDTAGNLVLQFSNTTKVLDSIKPSSYGLTPGARSLLIPNISGKTKVTLIDKQTTSLLALGQFNNDRLSLLLVLENTLPEFFNKYDVEIITSLLEAYSLSIKRSTLYEGLEQKVEKQKRLLEAVSEIYQQSSTVDVYQTFLNVICKSLKINQARLDLTTASVSKTANE